MTDNTQQVVGVFAAEPGWRFTWVADNGNKRLSRPIIGWALLADSTTLPVTVDEDGEYASAVDPDEWPAPRILPPRQRVPEVSAGAQKELDRLRDLVA